MIIEIEGVRFVDLTIVHKISNARGFVEVFEANLSKYSKFIDAYEATEDIHEAVIGRRRYSDYANFSHIRARLK